MEILKTLNLTKTYGKGESEVQALRGVDLSVNKGEFLSIVGTSGSGKSTLLHMLGGLDRPTSGKVIIDDKDISKLSDEALTIFRRRKIGFIFQAYNLVPLLTVYENIVLPAELDGRKPDKKYVDEVIAALGLEQKLDKLPTQLSGGQQQRVAIATSQDVMGLLGTAGKHFGQTIVMITHNDEIAQTADRTIRIEDGLIINR